MSNHLMQTCPLRKFVFDIGQQLLYNLVPAGWFVRIGAKASVDLCQQIRVMVGFPADHDTIEPGQVPFNLVERLYSAVDMYLQ